MVVRVKREREEDEVDGESERMKNQVRKWAVSEVSIVTVAKE